MKKNLELFPRTSVKNKLTYHRWRSFRHQIKSNQNRYRVTSIGARLAIRNNKLCKSTLVHVSAMISRGLTFERPNMCRQIGFTKGKVSSHFLRFGQLSSLVQRCIAYSQSFWHFTKSGYRSLPAPLDLFESMIFLYCASRPLRGKLWSINVFMVGIHTLVSVLTPMTTIWNTYVYNQITVRTDLHRKTLALFRRAVDTGSSCCTHLAFEPISYVINFFWHSIHSVSVPGYYFSSHAAAPDSAISLMYSDLP